MPGRYQSDGQIIGGNESIIGENPGRDSGSVEKQQPAKVILFTCSITWAFGKKSGSSFHFPPTSETGSAISWRKSKIMEENRYTRRETVAMTGVQKSASVHPLHEKPPNGRHFSWSDMTGSNPRRKETGRVRIRVYTDFHTRKTAVKDRRPLQAAPKASLTAGYSLHPLQWQIPAGLLPTAGIFHYA